MKSLMMRPRRRRFSYTAQIDAIGEAVSGAIVILSGRSWAVALGFQLHIDDTPRVIAKGLVADLVRLPALRHVPVFVMPRSAAALYSVAINMFIPESQYSPVAEAFVRDWWSKDGLKKWLCEIVPLD